MGYRSVEVKGNASRLEESDRLEDRWEDPVEPLLPTESAVERPGVPNVTVCGDKDRSAETMAQEGKRNVVEVD